MRRDSAGWFLVVVTIAWLSSTGIACAQDARALFEQGESAYRLGRYEDAIDAWERAYALDPRPGLQYNLAQAYGRLGRIEDEQRSLALYIDRASGSSSVDPEQLDLARARLVAIGDRIRRTGMQLTGVPDDARVRIDDAEVARDDEGTYLVPLDPGAHRVEVTAAGFEEFNHSIVVRAGETVVVPVMLSRARPGASDGGSEGRSSPLRGLGIAGLSIGGASLAVGGVLGVLALQRSDDVYDGSSDADRARSFALGADISFGVGAAFAVTGLVLVLVGRPHHDDEAPLAVVVPTFSHDSRGLALVGRF